MRGLILLVCHIISRSDRAIITVTLSPEAEIIISVLMGVILEEHMIPFYSGVSSGCANACDATCGLRAIFDAIEHENLYSIGKPPCLAR